MGRPSISIVIPNLHSPVLGQVLDALDQQIETWDGPVDVWVVGRDRFCYARSEGSFHFWETDVPVSPARARNLGASVSQGDVLIFLDADCIPQPGWLAQLLAAFDRWPLAGAISGAMSPQAPNFPLRCGQIAGFHEHLCLNASGRRQGVVSFSLLVPRKVWQDIGGFDERFTVAEDLDFSIRIVKSGRSVYLESRAVVYHAPSRGTWSALWKHAMLSGRHSIQVRCLHHDWYHMPFWARSPWAWRVLSLGIGIVRALQIYRKTPALWQYWYCFPWVVLSKVAWCWGAAGGLESGRH